jgi:signal transduction histidine kinase
MGQGLVKLDQVAHFVLDEADRMLDMGFIHDVRRVLVALPKVRQTLFNLISNAAKFTEKGTITLVVSRQLSVLAHLNTNN